MLRKKYHVVRKKNHVVRKLFYVASIFCGAAGRKNRPPWTLSSTAGEVSSTAWTLSPTASVVKGRVPRVAGAVRPPFDNSVLKKMKEVVFHYVKKVP